MSLTFCDLLVLGSDLSGVMTATLLAKRGMNVLILDDEEEDEPFPNLALGLSSRSFKSLLGKLMIPDTKLQIFQENRVGCQVVFPRHRLDLYTSRPLFLKEIEREFPQDKPVFEELMAEIDRLRENYLDEILAFLPLVGSREKNRFLKRFEAFPSGKVTELWNQLSPIARCFIKVRLKFLSKSPLLEPLLIQLLLFLPSEEGTTFSIRGGVRELKKLFFSRLDYFGGLVHPLGSDPLQIVNKGREVRSLQLFRYNFPTRCRYLLGNADVRTLYQILPSPWYSFLLGSPRKKILSLKPREERGLVQYHVSSEILPGPMKENLVYVTDPEAPLEGANYLEINLNPLPKGAGELDTLLTVSFIPGSLSFQKINAEIGERLHRLVPFANSHFRQVFPLQESEADTEPDLFPRPDDLARFERLIRKRVSFGPSLFFPPINSPFKNVFSLGPNVLEGLGMEGKMLAALRAIDLIWARELKVRNP